MYAVSSPVGFGGAGERALSPLLRLGAAGPKTNAISLPRLLGVRIHRGDTLVLGLSGHLHRYGVALRLEDRTTRKVLWELNPTSDSTGEVGAMPVSKFLWSLGKPLRPDHVYRLTAVYENPEPRTIPDGGMGVIGGVVLLPRGTRWPSVDRRHPEYVVDVESILGPRPSASVGKERIKATTTGREKDAVEHRHH